MTVHADGTMDVLIDGKTERRTYHVRKDIDPRVSWVEYVPDLREGEHLVMTLGSPIPTIINTLSEEDRKFRQPHHGHEGESE